MKDIKDEFRKRFNREPEHIFFSPGRVNLIGEHIDYNGGQVMPCAISLGTYLALSANSEKLLRFECLNFPETATIPLQSSYSKTGKEWFNYPLGVIDHVVKQEHDISGLDMLFYGNLPIGAGLSSSASIEVLTAFALSTIFDLKIAQVEIALLSKKVENEFIGMNCGIMDQFAVSFGKTDHAILLDCDTLDYKLLPFQTRDFILAIINTNKARKLTDSKYNERFAECGAILKKLQARIDVKNLCEISLETFEANRDVINDPVLEKRALHVITENFRVHEAARVLKDGRLEEFGQLMYASHESLKNLYEVSGVELDTIVDFCKNYEDCIGARMTGAGFGGCAIALIKKEKLEDFTNGISTYYTDKIGYPPSVFASNIGDGVRELEKN